MIRGQTRTLETPEIKTKLNASIHNRFDVEVIDAKTGKVKQKAFAENIVLDSFWTYWFYTPNNSYYNLAYIAYGSGTGTLDATRTTLFNEISRAFSGSAVYERDDTNCTYSAQKSIVLGETTAVGETITEVGISASSSAAIATHAMLQDMNGNQISITKTGTDIINIYATVYLHWSESALNGFELTDSMLKHLVGATSPAGYSSNWLTIYMTPVSGTITKAGVGVTVTRDTTNHKISVAAPRIAAGTLNGHGIKYIRFAADSNTNSSNILTSTDAPFDWRDNDEITGESIGTGDGTTTAFSTYFPYVQNATVYVDGVAQTSGVTVTNSSSYTDDIVFDTAPSSGAAITIDYETSVIAKDENHVFDFTLEITCNEYTA